ncbi:uncharacterized protein LOC111005251 isoform X1 [Momordica charantia]|uniref:Protein preY, mitochondrial n=1 Tax=Momordica charantia TaxID=3673 RepID=A0A6J1BTN7_MOMCH|nr:uncharacterized protein LOC111005251 isoform X1 [Momordica charantia]
MVRISGALLKDAGSGLTKTLSEILVCPLTKQPLRYCEASNSLISDTIGVSFPGLVAVFLKVVLCHNLGQGGWYFLFMRLWCFSIKFPS